MTLAGAPAGFIPWLAADLARAAKGRAVFIAPDEAAMRHIVDAAHYFAPELETLSFPAWDCLPYDRSSPSLRSSSERLATLHALQRKAERPQLLVTTVNAATQRTLTPFRVRQLVARLAPGSGSTRESWPPCSMRTAICDGHMSPMRASSRWRGGLHGPQSSGPGAGAPPDFFGVRSERQELRAGDAADDRNVEGFTLLPASETLLWTRRASSASARDTSE
jgi:transcription-repair coupling factor (superfamily II helicase)